jgi:hypothetical protein
MVLCGSYMHNFSVSEEMKKNWQWWKEKGGDNRESGGTFISNINHQRIEN